MKNDIDIAFEHAVRIGVKQTNYSYDVMRAELMRQLRINSGSQSLSGYYQVSWIKYVVENVWGFDWEERDTRNNNGCDCGAKHTWAPTHHSDWCSVLNTNRNDSDEIKLSLNDMLLTEEFI